MRKLLDKRTGLILQEVLVLDTARAMEAADIQSKTIEKPGKAR